MTELLTLKINGMISDRSDLLYAAIAAYDAMATARPVITSTPMASSTSPRSMRKGIAAVATFARRIPCQQWRPVSTT
jgi:hypothetical protein